MAPPRSAKKTVEAPPKELKHRRARPRKSSSAVPRDRLVHAVRPSPDGVSARVPTLVLPLSWSSPPQNILRQIHTPPSLVECFRGSLRPVHRVATLAGIASRRDEDVFALLTLPNLLDASPRPRAPREAAPCSRALASHLTKALATVRADMGSADAIPCSALTIAVLVRPADSGAEDAALGSAAWHIAGLVLAHELHRAYRAHSKEPDASPHSAAPAPAPLSVGDIWCTGTSLCGVQLMWVAEAWRGRGLAFAMVEQARRQVCYGHCVDNSLVAFSEPTRLGLEFARRYADRDDFFVF